jgi:hypothetical protein
LSGEIPSRWQEVSFARRANTALLQKEAGGIGVSFGWWRISLSTSILIPLLVLVSCGLLIRLLRA